MIARRHSVSPPATDPARGSSALCWPGPGGLSAANDRVLKVVGRSARMFPMEAVADPVTRRMPVGKGMATSTIISADLWTVLA